MENVICDIEQNKHLLENYQLLVKTKNKKQNTLKITPLDKLAIVMNITVPKPAGYFKNVIDMTIKYV